MAAKTALCMSSTAPLARKSAAPIPGVAVSDRRRQSRLARDGKGFWYTRYPGPDRPAAEQHFFQQLYFHLIGTDSGQDTYVLGKGFPKVAEILLEIASTRN